MSKLKNTDKMNTEKELARLVEEIKKQGFETAEEVAEFLKSMQGQSLADLPEGMDAEDRSQDLVFEAYEQTVPKGRKLIKQALELDPNNADAYIYLASIEKDIDKAVVMFEKAIEASKKKLGKKLFEQARGYFWGVTETRPYMRAKAGLADCLYAKKEVDKAIEIYEEMLELNPNDNQGIRYLLSTLLLSKEDLTKYELFIKESEDEDCAVWNYNNALYSFRKSGRTTKTKKILKEAYKSNEFVIDYMLGIKKIPAEEPQYIGRGDENEAISYVISTWTIWEKTEGALDWLYEFKDRGLKMI